MTSRQKSIGWGVGVGATVILVVAAMFAMPIDRWRTGRLPASPLRLIEGGPEIARPSRIWIDTDAACGLGRRTDPDDCLALLYLTNAPGLEIAGISSVFGNTDLQQTDWTAREVVKMAGLSPAIIHRGAEKPLAETIDDATSATAALRAALREGPLTIVALGPLTNIAAVLGENRDLMANVERLVAVMGRRPGHLFHPAEGAGGGILFGHGPVFRDFNFDQDREASRWVISLDIPVSLIPYEAARKIVLRPHDINELAAHPRAPHWVAERSRAWLEYWKSEVGIDGFYPFDLLAATYVANPQLFDCARVRMWVGKDVRMNNFWFYDPPALLIDPPEDDLPEHSVRSPIFCANVDTAARAGMMRQLAPDTDEASGWRIDNAAPAD